MKKTDWLCRHALLVGMAMTGGLAGPDVSAAGVIPLPLPGEPPKARVKPLRIDDPVTNQGEQWVTVEGRASLAAGPNVARKQALLDAYRKAINAGGSIEIGEFSQMRNFKDVVDIVTKRSHGYIRRYDLLADGPETKKPDSYMVAIRALVVDRLEAGKDDEESLRQFVMLIGAPKILFILAEKDDAPNKPEPTVPGSGITAANSVVIDQRTQNITNYNAQVNEAKQPVASEQPLIGASSAEHMMAERFRKAGYEVLTSDDILDTGFVDRADLARARQGLGSYAAAVGRRAGADVVISGDIRYQLSSMNGGTDVDARVGTVGLTAKAILPGSGRVLHVTTKRERHMSVQASSDRMAREESLARAGRIAADELKWEIPKILAAETRDVELSIHNVTYADANEIRRRLSTLPGVEGVEMAGWRGNQSRYIVKSSFTGPREEDLVGAISSRYEKLRITEVLPHKVEASF